MDLRTAVTTVVLLGIGFAAGALTTSAGETTKDAPSSNVVPRVQDVAAPGLETRSTPPVAASTEDIRASLARIEKLLMANPMAAGAPDEQIVERITEVWKPVLLDAIQSHQTSRARTRLVTLYEQRISGYQEAIDRGPDPRGPAFSTPVAEYEKSIREYRDRVAAIEASRTAAELVDALTASPDTDGHHDRSSAIQIVYGDKQPD